MANTVKLKRSAVAGKVPTTSDLELGELAVNTYDGKLYTKKDNGTASVVEIGAGGGSQNVFSTIAVSGQTSVAADSTTDTLTLAAGSGITITTDAASDTITFAASANALGLRSFAHFW